MASPSALHKESIVELFDKYHKQYRITALNDSDSSNGSQGNQGVKESTKEAKEAEAYSLYNKGLGLLRNGDAEQAEEVFRDLIDHAFLQEAWDLLEERGSEAIHPGLQLLYSIQKNLAAMATQRKDYTSAMESYLEAVKIDNSEVTVWYKVGITANKLEDFQLAKLAFEQGIECNPKHWPCLDNLITLMYALNNYMECLYYIGKAFEMEVHYDKGYALRNKIFIEQPCLKEDTEEFFEHCDPQVYHIEIEPEEAKEFVEEALNIRRRRQELSKPPEPMRLEFPARFKEYSWKCVGELLIQLYDKAATSDPPISMGLKMNVPDYTDVPAGEDETKEATTEDQVKHSTNPNELQKESNENDKKTGFEQRKEESMDVDVENAVLDPACKSDIEQDLDELPQAAEIENTTPAVARGSLVQDDTKTGLETVPTDEVTVSAQKTDVAGNDSKLEPDKNEVDKESDIQKVDDKEPYTEDVMVEDSDSVLEAFNTAHSLLNSLSPIKFNGNTNSPPKIQSEGMISEIVKDQSENMNKKMDSSVTALVKSTSFGFTVSDIISPSPEAKESPLSILADLTVKPDDQLEPVSGLSLTSDLTSDPVPGVSQSPVWSWDSVSKPPADINTASNAAELFTNTLTIMMPTVPSDVSVATSMISSVPIPVSASTPLLASNSALNASPLVTPSSTSSHSVEISSELSLQTSRPILTACLFESPASTSVTVTQVPETSSIMTGTAASVVGAQPHAPTILVPGAITMLTGSPTISRNLMSDFQSVGIPSVSQMGTSLPQSTLTITNNSQPQSKDHDYSKRYSDMPHMARSSSGRFLPVSMSLVPLAQSIPGTFDPAMLESSPGSASVTDTDDRSPGGRKAQKRRKISMATEEIMMYGKRRSARVRNTGKKKEEESVNFCELLQAFLPSSLKNVQEEDFAMEMEKTDSNAEHSANSEDISKDVSAAMETSTQVWDEVKEVQNFLQGCLKNQGLTHTLNLYLHILAKHCKVKWCEGLADVYIGIFNRVRKHLYMPNVFNTVDSDDVFQEMAQICLVWTELQLDQWLVLRSKAVVSPGLSPKSHSMQVLSKEDVPAFFEDDTWFLTTLCGQVDRLGDAWIDHCIRVYWMKARYSILRGKMEDAIFCYERTKEYIEYGKEENVISQVFIPNCKMDNFVNLEVVISQQDLLEKSHNVEETQRLFEKGDYEKVVEILLQTFIQPKHKSKMVKVVSDPAERQSQLVLLQDALYKTGNYSRCFLWGEESFHESYQEYRNCGNSDEKAEWVKTMVHVFSSLKRVLEKEMSIVKSLPPVKLVRFSQNLICLIDSNMSLPESVTEMVVDSVLPWILLYHVIKHEQERMETMRLKDSGCSDDMEDAMSSSYMLLNIAHDYLGSRAWCTKSDGAVLQFFMTVLKKKMEGESKFLEEYQQAFEQCVYCLYGHPNKKGKAKHLQDHNASGIALQWKQAIDVFDYFKPKTMPEFDGYKSETISTELEFLLKRIIPLVPEECKSMGVSAEEIHAYIEGVSSTAPVIGEGKQVGVPVIDELYYLLADYYLKNKETMKAIKFYIQDLCMNPSRLDSWAGMALARMSSLEAKLTSTELKMDAPVYKKSIAALRCFKRAVEIDDSNGKLWIEYGTLAYQLHSHACRQIKWKKWFAMEVEVVQIAVESKREMLQTALNCFKMAAECERDWNEDEWLHKYMVGKCLEKMRKPVKDVVPYYYKALEHIHEEHAKYPKKIVYAYTTPHLAVEALEMYYRMHAIILKNVMKHNPDSDELDYKTCLTYILKAAETPFARRVEKGNESRIDRESCSSADESSSSESPATKRSQTSLDHTYFRQKSLPGGNIGIVTEGAQLNKSASDVLSENINKSQTGSENCLSSENVLPSKPGISMVTTLELHSEEQTSKDNVTLTTTEVPGLQTQESLDKRKSMFSNNQNSSGRTETENSNLQKAPQTRPSFLISSILGESVDEVKEDVKTDNKESVENQETEVKNVLSLTEDLVEAKIARDDKLNVGIEVVESLQSKGTEINTEIKTQMKTDNAFAPMEIDDEPNGVVKDVEETKIKLGENSKAEEVRESEVNKAADNKEAETIVEKDEEQNKSNMAEENDTKRMETETKVTDDEKNASKIEDLVSTLLKKSPEDLHKYVIERCRQAFERCLHRFPTHYKSHYRLAYLYRHSSYQKNLLKAHHILLGVPRWQQVDYMPCQGLFGERKQTKFFQGIWKIPIDEIDRSGSFPSHLNRCIQLALDVLKDEKDSQTLHQVHLQLNRQPEPGKKYLRDAEKKYYALTSHRYTLDAVEMQIVDMKTMTDADVRLKFLLNVYRIWEHGVHKLNKHVERTNNLLGEAYRVVVRKLETLPQNMLLDQAVRFCKHQLAQKSIHKSQDNSRTQGGEISKSQSGVMSTNDTASAAVQRVQLEQPVKSISSSKLISLSNIMKSQNANYSLLKSTLSETSTTAVTKNSSQLNAGKGVTADKVSHNEDDDVIILSDSCDSSPLKVPSQEQPKPTNLPPVSSAPTVKIKMGLLQAVKRLKPADNNSKQDASEEANKPLFEDFNPKTLSKDESEAPIPSDSDEDGDNSDSSSSSSSSSSDSESSSDEDDDEDDNADDKDDSDDVDDDDESEDESGDESEDDDGRKDKSKITKKKTSVPIMAKDFKIVAAASTHHDELDDESNEDEDEVDLLSAEEEEKDNNKDADYAASEDEDIIMISDDEYTPKGRAVIPSPPHQNVSHEMEVLVDKLPDFDPILSSIMASEPSPPIPMRILPVGNKGTNGGNVSVTEIDSD